jgi:ubiquinone/menaquinone biosynthesis C-methylase UbiE
VQAVAMIIPDNFLTFEDKHVPTVHHEKQRSDLSEHEQVELRRYDAGVRIWSRIEKKVVDLGDHTSVDAFGELSIATVWKLCTCIFRNVPIESQDIHLEIGCGNARGLVCMQEFLGTELACVGLERDTARFKTSQYVVQQSAVNNVVVVQKDGYELKSFKGVSGLGRFTGSSHGANREIEKYMQTWERFLKCGSAKYCWDTKLTPAAFQELNLTDAVRKQWRFILLKNASAAGNSRYNVYLWVKDARCVKKTVTPCQEIASLLEKKNDYIPEDVPEVRKRTMPERYSPAKKQSKKKRKNAKQFLCARKGCGKVCKTQSALKKHVASHQQHVTFDCSTR